MLRFVMVLVLTSTALSFGCADKSRNPVETTKQQDFEMEGIVGGAYEVKSEAEFQEMLADALADPAVDDVWVEETTNAKGQVIKQGCKRIGDVVFCWQVVYDPDAKPIAADPYENLNWVDGIGPDSDETQGL